MAHLVFQTAYPGDLFLSIPLLKRLRIWSPNTPIVLACRPGLGEFFLTSRLVDEVVEIDKRTAAGRRRARRQLAAREWDAVFVPHESVRTALWMWGVKSRMGKVAFKKWWNGIFYSRRLQKPGHLPDALRQLSLLTAFDADLAEKFRGDEVRELASPRSLESPMKLASVPEWASMRVKPAGLKGQKRIFLAPGSVWPTKRWTKEGFEKLAESLLARGFYVDLVGSPAEKELCDEIAARVPGARNLAGKTSLGGLVELFTQGEALICNDSGAMHAAAAAGLPTVAVFGPTTLAQGFRPWQSCAVIVQKNLGCRPCGKHGAKKCPLGTHECMKALPTEEVLEALDSLLEL